MNTEQTRETKQHDGSPKALPAIVSGVLGMLIIAASPWLLLSSDAVRVASEQPAFQAARAFPSVAESKRIFGERAGVKAAQKTGITLAAGVPGQGAN